MYLPVISVLNEVPAACLWVIFVSLGEEQEILIPGKGIGLIILATDYYLFTSAL